MANVKISQLTPKGANLASTDLLEISEFDGSGYVTKSVTGQDIIDAAAGGGVTNITVNAPLSTTGGTTPDLAISEADASTDGFITAVDWNTFNGKQDLLVSATNIKTINGNSLLGSGDLVVSGGGGGGVHALIPLASGEVTTCNLSFGTFGSSATILNRLWGFPFFPLNTVVSSNLYINVAAAIPLSNCRILIYSDLNGKPDSKLYESANLDCSTLGIKTATTSFTFTGGTRYWLALHSSSTASVSNIPSSALMMLRVINSITPITSYIQTVAFGSAPATWGAANGTNTLIPLIAITQA
jgi:hypothetical protein